MQKLETFQLTDCELYTSCGPCPMCLSAIYWSRLKQVYFANSRKDAVAIGFDDDFIYQEIQPPLKERKVPMKQLLRKKAKTAFEEWKSKVDKIPY